MSQNTKPAPRLRDKWWWFNPANASEKTKAAALAWETLRRTKSYPALWRKCVRERAAFLGDQASRTGEEACRRPMTRKQFLAQQHQAGLDDAAREASRARLAHLFQRVREATPAPCFDFLMHGFDPALTWLEHSEEQRLIALGYVIGRGNAFKVNREYTLPRQTPAPEFKPSIRPCTVARNPAHKIFVSPTPHFAPPLVQASDCSFFRALDTHAPVAGHASYWDRPALRHCLSIYFDTRASRDQLLAVLREQPEFWKPAPDSGTKRLARSEVRIIPSDIPPFAIFLAPATCTRHRLLAAFHTQLKAPERKKWLRRCVRHWKTQRVEFTEPVRNPDGTVQGDANGFPLWKKVTSPCFDPAKHLRPKSNAPKSAGRVDDWLGLAANDIVKAGQVLGKKSEEARCLLARCGTLSELRNRQRSASRRLHELDDFFGRPDKNLAHWVQQNKEIAEMDFFAAAAGKIP